MKVTGVQVTVFGRTTVLFCAKKFPYVNIVAIFSHLHDPCNDATANLQYVVLEIHNTCVLTKRLALVECCQLYFSYICSTQVCYIGFANADGDILIVYPATLSFGTTPLRYINFVSSIASPKVPFL